MPGPAGIEKERKEYIKGTWVKYLILDLKKKGLLSSVCVGISKMSTKKENLANF